MKVETLSDYSTGFGEKGEGTGATAITLRF